MEDRPQEKIMSKEDMIYFLEQLISKIKADDTEKYMSYENMRLLLNKLISKIKINGLIIK